MKRSIGAPADRTNSRNERLEKRLDQVSGFLIGLTVLILPLDTWPDAPKTLTTFISFLESAIMWIFAAEYATRICLARRRFKYLFSFYGLLDAVTILPYFLVPGFDWQELRCLRLLRLLRLSKAIRYSEATRRFAAALSEMRGEATVFICATATVLYVAAYGIWHFEHEAQPEAFATIFHSLWWAVATLTTVGYGDVYPITVGGKVFTSVIAFLSLGVVASLAGLVASALTKVAGTRNDGD